MILSMSGQVGVFLETITIGVFSGLFYDLFRVFRRYIKHSEFVVHAQDLLYWLIAAAFMFFVILNRYNGQIRVYFFIGFGLGMMFYFQVFSRFITYGLCFVINLILKILEKIFFILFAPIKFIYKRLKKLLQKITNYVKIKPCQMKIFQKVKLKLKPKPKPNPESSDA